MYLEGNYCLMRTAWQEAGITLHFTYSNVDITTDDNDMLDVVSRCFNILIGAIIIKEAYCRIMGKN